MRKSVTPREISKHIYDNTPPQLRGALPRSFVDYVPSMKYKSLQLPSYVHGYSLAIEYMKKWFLDKFPKNYFKYVHINGKHVLDDWRSFNVQQSMVKKECPMLAMVPTVDYDFDRENVDLYQADARMLLHRSDYQQSFLKDYQSMTFLYLQMRALKMNFNFKIRVNSRSEQMDLYNRMELFFRIGSTQHDRTSIEFHIPYDMMLNVAEANDFDIVDGKIINIMEFVSYLNKHSFLPIIFKMRAINQKPEFFVRLDNFYTHISCVDKIQLDDGERVGKLDQNFHLEFQTILTIPIPHFYAYFAQKPIVHTIDVSERNADAAIGIYSINCIEIPPENENRWKLMGTTSYLCEENEKFIDLSEFLLSGGALTKIIKYNLDNFISPASFIDIKIFRNEDIAKQINFHVDYQELKIHLENVKIHHEEMFDIAIYADQEYINNTLLTIENYGRIESHGTETDREHLRPL